jgi:hypothetical protein
VENFRYLNYDLFPITLDPDDRSTLIELKDPNCRSIFGAITFVSDIFLRTYKDDKSFIKSYFNITNPATHIKVRLRITLNNEELDRISDFVISAEIPQLRRENEDRINDLKIKILRNCARKHLSKLFASPILEIEVLNPDFYRSNYVLTRLCIENDSNNFFVMQYSDSGETEISKAQYLPKNFNRVTFADLLFNYLNDLDPTLKDATHIKTKTSDDCQSLDIFNVLSTCLNCHKYISILTIPTPNDA